MIEKGYSKGVLRRCHHRGRLSGYHHPTFCKHDRLRNCNRRFCWSPVYVRFRRRYRIRTQLCGIYLFYAKRHPEIQRETRKTWGERLVAIKESIWGMGVPIIILGGIYGGVFTPTEAAAVAAVYSIVVSLFVYRGAEFQGIYQLCS